MASYHLSTKPVSRGVGRSATAAAAYRAADRVQDLTTGQIFDYSRKRGVEHSEIVLPASAALRDINWARDRQALWNAAELSEKRRDARVAREYEIALPHEMSRRERVELVRAFAHELADRFGVAVDFSLHRPDREGDGRNFHAHVLTTTRVVEPTGLGAKAAIEWSNTDRYKKGLKATADEIKDIRARWADLTNEHLRAHAIEARVDHRTLAEQGVEREPTTHLGVTVWSMERRGIATQVGQRVREQQRLEAQQRLECAHELGRIEREGQVLKQSILDLSTDLAAAKAGRDQESGKLTGMAALDEAQRQGRETWLAMRQTEKATQAEQERTLAAEIAPVVLGNRPGRGLQARPFQEWNASMAAKPIEQQAQVLAAVGQRLQQDRAVRLAAVLEKARARGERRLSRVKEFAKQEPAAPTGVFGGLRRRAFEESHRAWRSHQRQLEQLGEQSQRQQQRLLDARQPFELQGHAIKILLRHAPEFLERVREHERGKERLERQRSMEQSREKDRGRDFDLER